MTPKIPAKIKQIGYTKIKSSSTTKRNNNKKKRQIMGW
jgi:hypothetical protein